MEPQERPKERNHLRLRLVTWNVGTASPPPEVTSLLQLNSPDQVMDMYVIGGLPKGLWKKPIYGWRMCPEQDNDLQEVNSRIVNFLSDMAFDDPWSIFFMTVLSPLGYVKVSSIRMQGLLLLIFAKHAHLPFIQDIKSQFTRTGLYGYWGNKGGVTIRMSLYGHTVCFMNCHLPAHMENLEQRLDDFEHILEMQQFEGERIPSILDHDVLFWFGDLNFRIEDYGLHFIRESINSSRLSLLWEKDQLNMAKKKEAFLQEFIEGPLKFKPTYKFDLYSNEYDTSGKKRKPAWTDRILWRVKRLLRPAFNAGEVPEEEEEAISVSLHSYDSHMSYGISDHKPVTGTFELELQTTAAQCRRSHPGHQPEGPVPEMVSDCLLTVVPLDHQRKLVQSCRMCGVPQADLQHNPMPVCSEMRPLMSVPLVVLRPMGEWSAGQDATVSYSTVPEFPGSAWDWIALYKVTFRHPNDYVMYAWVQDNEISSGEDAKQVYLGAEELPASGGEFLLGYYSHMMQSIVGLSQPFKVQPNRTATEMDLLQDGVGGKEKFRTTELLNDF